MFRPLASPVVSKSAPIEALFRTFARRVRSRGELGEMSSLNQKLWLQYRELDKFLSSHSAVSMRIYQLPQGEVPVPISLTAGGLPLPI